MGKALRYTFLFLFIAFSICSCSRSKVLSEKKMEDLYVDMFIADQWLRDHGDCRDKADSSLYYDVVFRKHHCTFEDYDASLKYYLGKTDKFVDLTKRVSDRLDKMADEMSKQIIRDAEIDKTNEDNKVDYTFVDFSQKGVGTEYFGKIDSTVTMKDTLSTKKDTVLVADRMLEKLTIDLK